MAAKRKEEATKRAAAAEKARKKAEEKARKKAEQTRIAAAEKARKKEQSRGAAAEKARKKAEEKAHKAEQLRIAAEEAQRLAVENASTPEAFVEALTKARAEFHQLVKLAELKKHVAKAAQQAFMEHWGPRVDEGDVPPAVGTLFFKVGKVSERRLFLLSDVTPGVGTDVSHRSGAGSPETLPTALVKERVLTEFDRLNERSGGRYYVSLADLRGALSNVSRAEFDAALNDLRRDWILTLSPAEGRHEVVPKPLLDAGILEQSRLLVYVSRRET